MPFPVSHFNVHQRADASAVLRLVPDEMQYAGAAWEALAPLFGHHRVMVEVMLADGKTMQYTSDIERAHS